MKIFTLGTVYKKAIFRYCNVVSPKSGQVTACTKSDHVLQQKQGHWTAISWLQYPASGWIDVAALIMDSMCEGYVNFRIVLWVKLCLIADYGHINVNTVSQHWVQIYCECVTVKTREWNLYICQKAEEKIGKLNIPAIPLGRKKYGG